MEPGSLELTEIWPVQIDSQVCFLLKLLALVDLVLPPKKRYLEEVDDHYQTILCYLYPCTYLGQAPYIHEVLQAERRDSHFLVDCGQILAEGYCLERAWGQLNSCCYCQVQLELERRRALWEVI
jgi:hypothetical protein